MDNILEIGLHITNEDYADSLMVALIRQGYNVYLNPIDNIIHFAITKDDMTVIECGNNSEFCSEDNIN